MTSVRTAGTQKRASGRSIALHGFVEGFVVLERAPDIDQGSDLLVRTTRYLDLVVRDLDDDIREERVEKAPPRDVRRVRVQLCGSAQQLELPQRRAPRACTFLETPR